MASVFKPAGKAKYVCLYFDENGKRRKKTLATDKAVSERIARDIANKVALRREGIIDPKAEAYRDHELTPLARHVADWQADLIARGFTAKHADHASNRVRRLVTVILGSPPDRFDPRSLPAADRRKMTEKLTAAMARARLSSLTAESVQNAMARIRDSGSSLQTCNHYRATARAFSKWLYDKHRTREHVLRGVTGYNAKEDRRHDRRTLGLEELRRLIEAAHDGPTIAGMTGPARSLCYRLAVGTGLRYAEISSLTASSFTLGDTPTVTVEAAYSKNGQSATLFIPGDLASDLGPFLADLGPDAPVFHLPRQKGAMMLRADLARAGIPYRDASGLVFDFHSLRCQCATLADAAGLSPRVVQKLMRHSSLEMTGRYTKLRAVDIAGAAARFPCLKPTADRPEAEVMTGTDPRPVSTATQNAAQENADGSKPKGMPHLRALSDGQQFLQPEPEPRHRLSANQAAPGRQNATKPREYHAYPRSGQPYTSRQQPHQSAATRPATAPVPATRSIVGDPDLEAIIEAWPDLPQAIRDKILEVVRASRPRTAS